MVFLITCEMCGIGYYSLMEGMEWMNNLIMVKIVNANSDESKGEPHGLSVFIPSMTYEYSIGNWNWILMA